MNHVIIYDTETTGLVQNGAVPLDRQPRIIEYAGMKVNWDTLEEIDRLTFRVNPGNLPLPPKITEITGLTDADLKDEPVFRVFYTGLSRFHVGVSGLCAHNLPFDFSLLRFDLARINKTERFPWPPIHICTVEASMSIKGHRLHLKDLHEMATGEVHQGAHRALADVEALFTVVKFLREKSLL